MYIYYSIRPEEFARLTDPNGGQGIQEALFRTENEEWYRQYYQVAAKNAIRMVSDGLPTHMEQKRDEIMGKLRAFLNEDVFFRTMSELAAARGPLTVFCHGDCWTNNILFKEDSSRSNDEVSRRLEQKILICLQRLNKRIFLLRIRQQWKDR